MNRENIDSTDLTNCEKCVSCFECDSCLACYNCDYCTNCDYCYACYYCRNCKNLLGSKDCTNVSNGMFCKRVKHSEYNIFCLDVSDANHLIFNICLDVKEYEEINEFLVKKVFPINLNEQLGVGAFWQTVTDKQISLIQTIPYFNKEIFQNITQVQL